VWPAGVPPPPAHESIPEGWLDAIDEAIKHRGPDGQGRFRDRAVRVDGSVVDVALVHRRLAIIDPACGQQPMVSERGRSAAEGLVAVVFNGCIYNHRELRRELEGLGHRFTTDHSDTEVLVHGWREWGGNLPSRFDSMHAAAVWDRDRASLFLTVDSTGEKPLFHTPVESSTHLVAFSSSALALYRLATITGQYSGIDSHPFGLKDLLQYGFLTEGLYTPLLNAWRVRPRVPFLFATTNKVQLEVFTRERHRFSGRQRSGWCPDPSKEQATAVNLEELLTAAVASRLETDVPLGTFLSGGVDSSLVTLLAKRALGKVQSFCLRMPDPRFDESRHAEIAAAAIGSQHTTLECSPNPASDLIALIGQLGWPLGDSSLLPTYWLSKAAREHVKVVLAGDGGDELFGGYERYRGAKYLARYRHALASIPLPLILSGTRTDRARRLMAAARGAGYPDLLAIFPTEDFSRLTGHSGRKPWGHGHSDPVAEAIYFDLCNYLPGDLLPKVDTASMAVALECRAPLLSKHLVESAFNTPIDVLMPGGQRKGLLRALARKYLPAGIVDRPKQGFAIPIGEWFRSDYGQMKTLLLDHLNAAEPWPGIGIELNRRFVQQMLDEHMNRKRDHSQRLYMLLVLSIWARNCLK